MLCWKVCTVLLQVDCTIVFLLFQCLFCCYFVRKCADFVNFSAVFVVNVLHYECESDCNAAVFFLARARVRGAKVLK